MDVMKNCYFENIWVQMWLGSAAGAAGVYQCGRVPGAGQHWGIGADCLTPLQNQLYAHQMYLEMGKK